MNDQNAKIQTIQNGIDEWLYTLGVIDDEHIEEEPLKIITSKDGFYLHVDSTNSNIDSLVHKFDCLKDAENPKKFENNESGMVEFTDFYLPLLKEVIFYTDLDI